MAALSLFCALPGRADVRLSSFSGSVQVLPHGGPDWKDVKTAPVALNDGDLVRTSARSAAVLTYSDGSRLGLSPNAAVIVDESTPESMAVHLALGVIRAIIAHVPSRRFEVRTPTAVCAVRGTEFRVEVLAGGATIVDLYKGLLGVTDNHGQQILLHPNDRVQIDRRAGLGNRVQSPASKRAAAKQRFHNLMRRELAFDFSRKAVQAAAVRELRLADYQQGKSLINAFGDRVRVEQYIVRPTPSSFKLVVLNDSRTAGFNYFYYLGQFNTTLPTDLSVALRQLSGTIGAPPTWYLTSITDARSNGGDSLIEIANGGHPVNVNSGTDPTEAVTSYFSLAQNAYVPIAAGQAFYRTFFDNEGLYANGDLKSGWTGSNIQTYNLGYGAASPIPATTNDPITGAALAQALPFAVQNAGFPQPGQIHEVVYDSYSDGTFLRFDNFIINDQGQVATAADFGAPGGTSFTQQLLNFNYEQVVTATEFGGRKIDIVVAPKMLVESGLIQ